MPHETFQAILALNAEMAEIAAGIARDETLDPRIRVGASVATSKIVVAAAPVIKTMYEVETAMLDWSERVLAKSATPVFDPDNPVDALKLKRATEHMARLALPSAPDNTPDW